LPETIFQHIHLQGIRALAASASQTRQLPRFSVGFSWER
jgi:hypothetical protein